MCEGLQCTLQIVHTMEINLLVSVALKEELEEIEIGASKDIDWTLSRVLQITNTNFHDHFKIA